MIDKDSPTALDYTDFSRHVYLNDPDAEQGKNEAEETIV